MVPGYLETHVMHMMVIFDWFILFEFCTSKFFVPILKNLTLNEYTVYDSFSVCKETQKQNTKSIWHPSVLNDSLQTSP